MGIFYDRTKTFVNAVSGKFTSLAKSNHFDGAYQELGVLTFTARSPIALTGSGRKLAKQLEVQDTVDKMLPKVQKLLPKNPSMMDIQRVCFDYAFDGLMKDADTDLRHKIDRRAYYDKGNYRNTLMVYGILFRDALFKKLGLEG